MNFFSKDRHLVCSEEEDVVDLESTTPVRYRPLWFKVLECVLFAGAFAALLAFVIKEATKDSDVPEIHDWRLDTAKNYTMDTLYWRKETEPKERHYYFNVSTLLEKASDGIVRNLTVINGQYPGPLVEANAGDTLYIHVQNHMSLEPVTIHCHGLFFNQEDSYNDGAAFINQCAIPANGGTYTYKVKLGKEQWGTYWYHSHFSTQYADGLFGPLVIHSSKEDELLEEKYDMDMVVLVNDYYHDMANKYLVDYLAPDNENNEPTPDNGLIQGFNVFEYDSASYVVPHEDLSRNVTDSQSNYPIIDLKRNKKYRMRVINAGFFAPFTFSIDQHLLKLIEADGTNIEPLSVESLAISVSQRYSFIVNPQCQEENCTQFWMHARFNKFCFAVDNPDFDTDVKAIVSYDKDIKGLPESKGWGYNGGDVKCRDMDQSLLKTLNPQFPMNKNGSRTPDILLNLDVAFLIKGYQLDRGYFNDMTYTSRAENSTMYDLAFNPYNNTIRSLNDNQLETKNENQYLINLDQRGQIVDFVLNNYDDGAHPFHMHGHKFWVLKVGDTGYFKKTFYEEDSQEMNFENPILRDTINVSGYGYAVIRFVVDNPGVWPFHCHIGWHMESGLLLQINALQSEYSKWSHYPQAWADLCAVDSSH